MAAGSIVIDLLMKTGSFETHTKKAAREWQKFEKSVTDGSGRMEKAVKLAGGAVGVAAGAITAAAGSVAVWAKSVMDASREINRLSQIANSTTKEFQQWSHAAKTVGIEQDKLSDILKDVNDKAGEFLSTGGGEMKDFFENIAPKVGVTAEQFRRLSGPQALQFYYSSLQKAGVSQKEMTFYMEALANDATALTPLLANNGEELRKLANDAERMGLVMEDHAIASALALEKNITQLQNTLQGFTTKIANEALPMLNAIADEYLKNDRNVTELHDSVSAFAKDNSFKTWIQDALLLMADLADWLNRIKMSVQSLAGSFKVVMADLRYMNAWGDAKISIPGSRTPEDQAIADAILAGAEANRERTLREANASYDRLFKSFDATPNRDRVSRALSNMGGTAPLVSPANQSANRELNHAARALRGAGEATGQASRRLRDAATDFSKGLRIKPGANRYETQQGTYALAQLLQSSAGANLRHFSAFNDGSRAHSRNSKHHAGLAFDATFHNGAAGAQQAIRELTQVLSRLGFQRGKDYGLLDEYANPSPRSTGGHLHFQWQNRAAAERFKQFMAGSGGIAENELQQVAKLNESFEQYLEQRKRAIALMGEETELGRLNAEIRLGTYAELEEAQLEEMRRMATLHDQATEQHRQQARYKELLESITGDEAVKNHLEDVRMLTEAWGNGQITAEQYQLAIGRLQVPAQLQDPNNWSAGINDGLQEFMKSAGTMRSMFADATTATIAGLESGLNQFAATGKLNFREMTVSILKDLSRIAIRMAMLQLIGSFTGGGSGAAAGTGSSAIGALFANGGYVTGPGTGRSDSIPARLSNGEFVINAAATARNRPLLEAINRNRFADGGYVGGGNLPVQRSAGHGQTNNINVTVHTNSDDPHAVGEQTSAAILKAMREVANQTYYSNLAGDLRENGAIHQAIRGNS